MEIFLKIEHFLKGTPFKTRKKGVFEADIGFEKRV